MNARLFALLAALVAFGAYTAHIAVLHGPLGFLEARALEGWGLQVFLDLVIALACFNAFAWPDAKRRDITYVPWLVFTMTFGSVGVLAYLVRRELARTNAASRGRLQR